MNITINLCQIDYAALLQAVSPNAGRMAGILPQSSLSTLAIQAMNSGDGFLCHRLEKMAAEKGLKLSLEGLHAQSTGAGGAKITAKIGEIDIKGLANLVLPTAQRALWTTPRLAFLGDALGREPDAYTQGMQGIWDSLSPQEQKRLLTQALKAYQEPLVRFLNRLAHEKGLSLQVESVCSEDEPG